MSDENKLTLKVTLEKVIHNTLRQLAQEVMDSHGVAIVSVHFSWSDVHNLAEPKMIMRELQVETKTAT